MCLGCKTSHTALAMVMIVDDGDSFSYDHYGACICWCCGYCGCHIMGSSLAVEQSWSSLLIFIGHTHRRTHSKHRDIKQYNIIFYRCSLHWLTSSIYAYRINERRQASVTMPYIAQHSIDQCLHCQTWSIRVVWVDDAYFVQRIIPKLSSI